MQILFHFTYSKYLYVILETDNAKIFLQYAFNILTIHDDKEMMGYYSAAIYLGNRCLGK